MSHFESVAFNRALPPLRLLNRLFYFACRGSGSSRIRPVLAGVRSGVPFVFAHNEPVHGRGLVLRCEMGVAHDHLQCSVPEQFCDCTQIYPGHNQSTCKSMTVAMPRVAFDSGPLESRREPASRALQGSRGWFPTALEGAGIEGYTWHCNRHTFASRLVMAGVDLRTVAELLGHRTLQMVMRYSHLAPEHQASAVDRLVVRENERD